MKDYLPEYIIPRRGENKILEIHHGINNDYFLSYGGCRKNIRFQEKINLSENNIIGIGLYLAEGKKEKLSKFKKSNHNGEISFDNSDPGAINSVINLLKKFGVNRNELKFNIDLNINYKSNSDKLESYWSDKLKLNPHSKRKGFIRYVGVKNNKLSNNTRPYGCLRIAFSSVILINIFIPFLLKFFREVISKKDKKVISLILKGYFAGDGHVSFSQKISSGRKHVEFLCNDAELRSLLKTSLKILGINNIKETNPLINRTHTHALRIYNRTDFLVLNKYRVLDFIDYKRETFSNLLSQYKTIS